MKTILARFLDGLEAPGKQRKEPKKRGPKTGATQQILRAYTLSCPDPRCKGLAGQLIQDFSNSDARKQLKNRDFRCPYCKRRPEVHSIQA